MKVVEKTEKTVHETKTEKKSWVELLLERRLKASHEKSYLLEDEQKNRRKS